MPVPPLREKAGSESFALTMPLRYEPWQRDHLDKTFWVAENIYNNLVADRKGPWSSLGGPRNEAGKSSDGFKYRRSFYIAFGTIVPFISLNISGWASEGPDLHDCLNKFYASVFIHPQVASHL